MSKVVLVTDSTAYIPPDLVQSYGIRIIPQVLVWGEDTFRDGVDIQPDEFYTRLQNTKVLPTTSQASPSDFKNLFSGLLESGYHVLTVAVSTHLSGTIASALQAQEQMRGAPIEVVDSATTTMAMGFLVLEAARAAEQGASLAECKALVENLRQNTGVIFAVDTLEFLHRGGRIGGGARLLGTALNIKPILEVCDGRVEAVERVRTRKKSITRLIELAEERIGKRQPIHLASLHASVPEEAKDLLEKASGHFSVHEAVFSEVSPVVGTHTGPGTIGLAFLAGS